MIVNYYSSFKFAMLTNSGSYKFTTEDIKVMLVSPSFAFSAANNISGLNPTDEVSGSGYTAGGQLLNTMGVTGDSINAGSLTWTASNFTASGLLLYKVLDGSLIAHVDFEGDVVLATEDFTVSWPSGVLSLSYTP